MDTPEGTIGYQFKAEPQVSPVLIGVIQKSGDFLHWAEVARAPVLVVLLATAPLALKGARISPVFARSLNLMVRYSVAKKPEAMV